MKKETSDILEKSRKSDGKSILFGYQSDDGKIPFHIFGNEHYNADDGCERKNKESSE
jgi:hypothetical protein